MIRDILLLKDKQMVNLHWKNPDSRNDAFFKVLRNYPSQLHDRFPRQMITYFF